LSKGPCQAGKGLQGKEVKESLGMERIRKKVYNHRRMATEEEENIGWGICNILLEWDPESPSSKAGE